MVTRVQFDDAHNSAHQDYIAKYMVVPIRDSNSLYKWDGSKESLPQLQQKARQADLEYSGLNRNQLIDRLQPHMDESLNILQPFTGKRYAALGKNKEELIEKAESMDITTANMNKKQLIAAIKEKETEQIQDQEDNPDEMGWYGPSQMLEYRRPSGKRTDKVSGYEKSDPQSILQHILKPLYDEFGKRALDIKWWNEKQRTIEPYVDMKKQLPRVVERYEIVHRVVWNDQNKTVKYK
jgi:hypothetical protein